MPPVLSHSFENKVTRSLTESSQRDIKQNLKNFVYFCAFSARFASVFLIFIVVPLIEIYLLIEIGSWVGAGTTIFLVVFTAVLGGILVQRQGMSTLLRVRQSMERGKLPAAAF